METEALGDLLVVDLSRVLAGPYATMLLADFGARVIKVERPGKGDDTRTWGPPFVGPPDQAQSTYFLSTNRNKESIVLDLADPGDHETLLRLLERADVVVENFRAGVLDRLGLAHARMRERNPGLVILSISGFGPDGPETGRPGYDQIVQGESGLMSLTGPDAEHPLRMGIPISDILTGIFGALGVVSALHQRTRTGEGQVVSTSLLASSVAVHTFQGTRWLLTGEVPGPQGNHHPTVTPYGAFRCRDGIIQIAVGNDSLWRSFAEIVGLDPDDTRFAHNAQRYEHRDVLTALIEERLSQAGVGSWLRRLAQAGVPAGEIKTLDRVYRSEQVASQGLIVEAEHPTIGAVRLPGPAVRLSQGMRRRHVAPPLHGEHTIPVRRWLAEDGAGGAGGADQGSGLR
ncbi:MAG TPA: CoA transferase [Acidimicrobiales bacterium]|nr:CoA transferase [Acidimicrobiales bacterium]